jgi:hypothetical protein
METTRPTQARYTYAYDGSGVALRTLVNVLAKLDTDVILVSLAEMTPERFFSLIDATERANWSEAGTGTVHPIYLTAVGSNAPLASFNWND